MHLKVGSIGFIDSISFLPVALANFENTKISHKISGSGLRIS